MDDNLRRQKIEMWKNEEAKLQAQLEEVMKAKGIAAAEGDLSENAAYKAAIEDSEMISARMSGIQNMIKELEKGESSK